MNEQELRAEFCRRTGKVATIDTVSYQCFIEGLKYERESCIEDALAECSDNGTAQKIVAAIRARSNSIMTDRELLELAAKAEGRKVWRGDSISQDRFFCECAASNGVVTGREWNPLTDDGDALRLTVKLEMQTEYLEFTGNARARTRFMGFKGTWQVEYCMSPDMAKKDPYAATRRAIVRAAAEIGKEMK